MKTCTFMPHGSLKRSKLKAAERQQGTQYKEKRSIEQGGRQQQKAKTIITLVHLTTAPN
jgi:hypothetical protein